MKFKTGDKVKVKKLLIADQHFIGDTGTVVREDNTQATYNLIVQLKGHQAEHRFDPLELELLEESAQP